MIFVILLMLVQSALTPLGDNPQVEMWRPLVSEYFAADQVDTALRVMECESGGDPNAKNPNSSASGLFQFLKTTWDWTAEITGSPTYDEGGPYDPVWSIRNAVWLQSRGSGWNQWSCY